MDLQVKLLQKPKSNCYENYLYLSTPIDSVMLQPDVKKHILEEDIPYSLGIMNAHSKHTQTSWTGDQNILRAMFVGSLIKGRLFLEFLGVTIDNRGFLKAKSNYRNDDISIEHLGGTMVKLDALTDIEQEIIRKFLISTNKHEAHLTPPEEENDLDHITPAFRIINQLLAKHLPK